MPRLDFMWFRPTIPELPQARFAIEATGTVTLPRGDYTIRTISDDGIRVWVDGRLLIDNPTLHGSEPDYAPLTRGTHEIKVEYFQNRDKAGCVVSWKYEGVEKQVIPASAFWHKFEKDLDAK